jgi:hypothetical protein
MKKYLNYLISIFLVSTLVIVSLYIYDFKDMYSQALNQLLIKNGFKQRQDNTADLDKVDLSKLNTYKSDFYILYYPDNYYLSFLNNSLIFYKELEQIADVKIINLKSDTFPDFDINYGNYFLSLDTNLKEVSNLPDFYNKYLNNLNDADIKKDQDIFIAYNPNQEESELAFKKYKVNLYGLVGEYKTIGMSDSEKPLENIFIFADSNLLIVANLNMPSFEELNYFLMLINLINKRASE